MTIFEKGKSSSIAECIRQRIALLKKEELNQLLTEGYKKRQSESHSLSKEFEAVDIAGWDEY